MHRFPKTNSAGQFGLGQTRKLEVDQTCFNGHLPAICLRSRQPRCLTLPLRPGTGERSAGWRSRGRGPGRATPWAVGAAELLPHEGTSGRRQGRARRGAASGSPSELGSLQAAFGRERPCSARAFGQPQFPTCVTGEKGAINPEGSRQVTQASAGNWELSRRSRIPFSAHTKTIASDEARIQTNKQTNRQAGSRCASPGSAARPGLPEPAGDTSAQAVR